jgi:hypothetical protein
MTSILIMAIMAALMPTKDPKRWDEGAMLPLLTRHAIQVLLKAGLSVSDTAKQTSASVDTVRRVRDEAPVEHVDDRAANAARRVGRPPKAASYGPKVARWLADDPLLPTQELLRRALDDGYSG